MHNSSLAALYLAFIAVSGADLLLTLNGMRVGFLYEANPFLVRMAIAANINLVVLMALSKAFAACLAFWLAFCCPRELQERARAGATPTAPSSATATPATVLIALTAATALLGVLPAVAGHLRHYLAD